MAVRVERPSSAAATFASGPVRTIRFRMDDRTRRDRDLAAAIDPPRGESGPKRPAPPRDDEVAACIALLRSAVFAEVFEPSSCDPESRGRLVGRLRDSVGPLLARSAVWESAPANPDPEPFIESLPEIARLARLDVAAAFEGDPSARSIVEVVLGLPGPRALLVHRAAHQLHAQGHRLLARLLAESAHRETGVDIHPGASIGESCFIDHGTGVVIGETAVIGDRCRIYQGVTLGARSFPRDEAGLLVRGAKRHPTLEDDVVVYANATILGGDTVIGRGSEIAGGAFVTSSVAEGHIAWTPRERPTVRPRVGG
jgi:serine O-acetyltransferase